MALRNNTRSSHQMQTVDECTQTRVWSSPSWAGETFKAEAGHLNLVNCRSWCHLGHVCALPVAAAMLCAAIRHSGRELRNHRAGLLGHILQVARVCRSAVRRVALAVK
jgi:hypothetical protein